MITYNLMDLSDTQPVLWVDNDLFEFLEEHSFETNQVISSAVFAEFWELYEEWVKEITNDL
jgi:hypothetical protein